MEGQEPPELVAAWKVEKRWFQWTVGFTAGLSVCVLGWLGLSYWSYLKLQEFNRALAAMSSADTAALFSLTDDFSSSVSQIRPLSIVLGVLLAVCGLGFLISLVKWLLAIRRRRAIHAGAFPRSGR